MGFKTRNLYYLRISEQSVLPIYVYLDERHLEWMSDQVLQHVLSDLRPRILPKLLAESGVLSTPASSKKATVDTHRGVTYQFCYFLRRTEPHSVVIKTRNYVTKRTQHSTRSGSPISAPKDRPASSAVVNIRKKRKLRRASTTSNASPPPRSTKKRRAELMGLDDSETSQEEGPVLRYEIETTTVDVDQDEVLVGDDREMLSPQDTTFDLPMDEEEEKPKPALQLKYKGFSIYGQCLCIVVEPWPTARTTNRTPQELGGISSKKSTPRKHTMTASTIAPRAESPLFLADDMEEENPISNTQNDLELMDDSDDDSEGGGMMAFSQALNLAGDNRPGAVEDEQEMEGAVLFGDADEARQL